MNQSGTKQEPASAWIVGDIHGQAEMLSDLLEALPRGPEDITVFLGDYLDRGPDSKGVVERVLHEHDLAPSRTVLLWGNHEDMAAEHFGIDAPSGFEYDPYDWFRNGGFEALASFGYPNPAAAFQAPCPDALAALFSRLKTYYRLPDAIAGEEQIVCVHAGVPTYEEPETAAGQTLLWVRSEFLDFAQMPGRTILHGHTPYKRVRVVGGKIGLDTGAAYGGPLTALQLPARKLYQAFPDGELRASDLPDESKPPRFR